MTEAATAVDESPAAPGLFDLVTATPPPESNPADAAATAIAHESEATDIQEGEDRQNA
jgi:hypothetical protein